jgi:LAO/AO transport system kinase
MIETIIQEALGGNKKSLARCISLLENDVAGTDDLIGISNSSSQVPVIGITGPPGAGKSSLVDAMLEVFDQQKKKVAVVCIDPSSPFHTGALLGDRIRMNRWHDHPSFFIRSLSSRGTTGGLHPRIKEITGFLKQCPFDLVLLETVGVGQSEVDVARMADLKVLVLVPEAGDEIQFMKSGLMEVADIFVVNKSDRPGAELFAKRLRGMAGNRSVLLTSAANRTGIETLVEQITNHKK